MPQTYTLQSNNGNFATDLFVGPGTIAGGTLVAGGDTLVIPATSGELTLSAAATLTVTGAVDISGPGSTLSIEGGVTGTGTIGLASGATFAGPANGILEFGAGGGVFAQTKDSTSASTTTLQTGENFILEAGATLSVSASFAVSGTYAAGNAPALSNQGKIISTYGAAAYNGGVELIGDAYNAGSLSASVINGGISNAAALISGGRYGVDFEAGTAGASSMLDNFGTIVNTGGPGAGGFNAGVVFGFRAGGTVLNTGLINPVLGAAIFFKTDIADTVAVANAVLNTGTLESVATQTSVVVLDSLSSAAVSNTGFIAHGVYIRALAGEGTITNAGSIGTNAGIAVQDATRGVLDLLPGQSLSGGIATFGASSTLELSGTPGSAGTLANPASYIGFTGLTIDTGAHWAIGTAANAVGIAGVTHFNDFGTLDIAGSLGGTSIDMEGSVSGGVVDFTGTNKSTKLYDFGGNDQIVLGGLILPIASAGSSFTDSYNTAAGVLVTSELNAAGSVVGTATITVSGTAALTGTSFVDTAGPGGVSIALTSGLLTTADGSINIDHGEHVTLANTAGVDTIPVNFGTHGTSLALNVLDLNGSGTASPYQGAISGFGLNDDIILGPSLLPSLATGSRVTLAYAGSLLTVAELNSAGAVTAATTLDVGTGYGAGSFVALLGTNGINIETPATVDEADLTFTGTTGTINGFEDPTKYAGSLAPGATIVPGETVIIAAGTASIASTSPVVDDGTIIVSGTGTTLIDNAPFTGTGIVSLLSHATLDAGGTLAAGTIDMGGGGADTLLDLSGSAAAGGGIGTTIINFGTLDTIQLTGFTATSASFVTGQGLELYNGTITETIAIAGSFAPDAFGVTADAGGTEILLCYLQGTRILTPAGETPIEQLAIGDAVITRRGGYRRIKWIGRQSYGRRFAERNRKQMPVRIRPGALGPNTPTRDLWVSPGHSMLLGGIFVLAECLVNGVTITQDDAPDDIHYHQLEFETHDCVMADGAWSESYADGPGLREKFHNEATFWGIYPDYQTPGKIEMCAARPEQGPVLEAVMRAVAGRVPNRGARPGGLLGFVDQADGAVIEGWAVHQTAGDLPVLLEILAAGRRLGTVLACGYRADLAALNYRRGWCRFNFAWPAGVPEAVRRDLLVRRAGDGAPLAMSPACADGLGLARPLWRETA